MNRRSTFGLRDWKVEAERYLDALATTIHERNEAYRELRECRAQLDAITESQPPAALGILKTPIDAAHTGRRGDGIVFVTPVERAVRIRTREGRQASLRQPVKSKVHDLASGVRGV